MRNFSIRLSQIGKLKQEEREIISLLKSFAVEIETLFDHYMKHFGWLIEENGITNGLRSHFVADQEYMGVFKANAHQIGKVKSDHLRKLILQTYHATGSLLDTFRVNNLLLDECNSVKQQTLIHDQNQALINLLKEKEGNMLKYAPTITHIHKSYCEMVPLVLKELRAEIK